MKQIISTIFTFTALLFLSSAFTSPSGVSHQKWDDLLKKYVNERGDVNYQGFMNNKAALESYLDILSNNPPQKDWSKQEKMAYWINAYNAFTVKLIVDHYPLESIQDLHPTIKIPGVSTVWHKDFFKIGGEDFDLDRIEHKILRKNFQEPRIHFAINCASESCPKLLNEAFAPEKLDSQLQAQTKAFVNDHSKNRISSKSIKISKIFKWFTGDFTKNGSLIDFLNRYSNTQIKADAEVDYMDYDWSLNDQANQ